MAKTTKMAMAPVMPMFRQMVVLAAEASPLLPVLMQYPSMLRAMPMPEFWLNHTQDKDEKHPPDWRQTVDVFLSEMDTMSVWIRVMHSWCLLSMSWELTMLQLPSEILKMMGSRYEVLLGHAFLVQ